MKQISPAAALFRISRAGFEGRFNGNAKSAYALADMSRGLIFLEDLLDGSAFVNRLRLIKYQPLYKAAPRKDIDDGSLYSDGADGIAEVLNDFVRWKLAPIERLTQSDLNRLERIEKDEEHDLDKVDLSNHIICTGYAGTGNTILGLQAALRKRVSTLFTSYNKVLA